MPVLSVTPFLLSTFYCIVVELLLLFNIFAVLQSHQFIGVCVCVCEWMCWFCTLDVLEFHPIIAVYFFSALWQICRLYTKICRIFVFLSISH